MDIFTSSYSMPLGADLYLPPPWVLRDCDAINLRYEADTEQVSKILPPGVEPLDDPVQCIAIAVIYGDTTLGPYNELMFGVRVQIGGKPYRYVALIYIDGDAPYSVGREVLGAPKKLAVINRVSVPSAPILFTCERPAQNRIATVTFMPDRAATVDDFTPMDSATLRFIPSSSGSPRPSICELLAPKATPILHMRQNGVPDAWVGRGELVVTPSATDPVGLFQPIRMLEAFQFRYDQIAEGWCDQLKDYLASDEYTFGEAARIATV
jgi:acetoacetate decarboxylase